MLQNLHVKNLALIDEIEVDFGEGLNILTGETGAGKSIILGSIHLALGGKFDKDMIRAGSEFGLVELIFSVENPQQIQELKELDIYPEDHLVILSRKFMESRSISKINGETVNMSTVKSVASILIDIYGQHEHQTLLNKKNHLTILDEYGGSALLKYKNQVAGDYKEYQKLKEKLDSSNMDEEQKNREIGLLEFEVNEINDCNLTLGEDEELEKQYKKMVHGKRIVESVKAAYGATGDVSNENASDLLSVAIRSLGDIVTYDEQAQDLYNQLADIDNLLNDFNRELSGYGEDFEFSQEDFEGTEERLNQINHLKTKYGQSIEEILAYGNSKEAKLQELADYEQYIEELEHQVEDARNQLSQSSEDLTSCRKKLALELVMKIKQGLRELNFMDVQFDMEFKKLEHFTSNGVDDAGFMVSMNPGEAIKPLGNVASGGELSRIMLAIKTVMADKDDIETLIFDEIDVGISGRTAAKVAEKMAVIGRKHQVICITHLAQIAAMAEAHYVIEKEVVEGKTKTDIRRLNEEQSITELTRILGGSQITEAMRTSAMEMKAMSKKMK